MEAWTKTNKRQRLRVSWAYLLATWASSGGATKAQWRHDGCGRKTEARGFGEECC